MEQNFQNIDSAAQAKKFVEVFTKTYNHFCYLFGYQSSFILKQLDISQKNLDRLKNVTPIGSYNEDQNRSSENEVVKFRSEFFSKKHILDQLRNYFHKISSEINVRSDRVLKGLERRIGISPLRIQMFELFTANETHVGDQCSICMEEIDVGRNMRRLTCAGQHYFCQECIEKWLSEHQTCPNCRERFD